MIHARVLYEFLYRNSVEGNHASSNRPSAWWYVADWNPATDKPSLAVAADVETLWWDASFRVAHLLVERLNRNPQDVFWEVERIRVALISVYLDFAERASEAGYAIQAPASPLKIEDGSIRVTVATVSTTSSLPEIIKPIKLKG